MAGFGVTTEETPADHIPQSPSCLVFTSQNFADSLRRFCCWMFGDLTSIQAHLESEVIQ